MNWGNQGSWIRNSAGLDLNEILEDVGGLFSKRRVFLRSEP